MTRAIRASASAGSALVRRTRRAATCDNPLYPRRIGKPAASVVKYAPT
ncbi:hypothetical protein BSIN_2908 [Burkholderia singularis]|uniref:Uncharacterized protein n=1 Tax=Burkholderia singularis TaxID=1503053 RepID=A0A238H3V8_9BURK|nr:hypothetical protein BSIN_2908 [Burkholderia singularis]